MPDFSDSDDDSDDAGSRELSGNLTMLRQKTGLITILTLMQEADRGILIYFFSGWHSNAAHIKWERLELERACLADEIDRVRHSAALTMARRRLAAMLLEASVRDQCLTESQPPLCARLC